MREGPEPLWKRLAAFVAIVRIALGYAATETNAAHAGASALDVHVVIRQRVPTLASFRLLLEAVAQVVLAGGIAEILGTVVVSNVIYVGDFVIRRSGSDEYLSDNLVHVSPRPISEGHSLVALVIDVSLDDLGYEVGPVSASAPSIASNTTVARRFIVWLSGYRTPYLRGSRFYDKCVVDFVPRPRFLALGRRSAAVTIVGVAPGHKSTATFPARRSTVTRGDVEIVSTEWMTTSAMGGRWTHTCTCPVFMRRRICEVLHTVVVALMVQMIDLHPLRARTVPGEGNEIVDIHQFPVHKRTRVAVGVRARARKPRTTITPEPLVAPYPPET